MTIRLPEAVQENLRFLIVEVDSQLANLQTYLSGRPTAAMARRILDRAGYAYNLKLRIHSVSVGKLAGRKKRRTASYLTLRAAETIATDLDRLTELCRECLHQLEPLDSLDGLQTEVLVGLLETVRTGLSMIEPAVQDNDTSQATALGQLDRQLEQRYRQLYDCHVAALRQRDDTEVRVRALLLAENFRHMGRALLRISEAIISANLGQQVSFERYHSLQALIGDLELDGDGLQVETIAETRSGSTIAGVSASNDDGYLAIYKDGLKQKVKEERKGVNSWHEIYPGLAPRILNYKKRGESAALLIEHLPGLTFEQLVLGRDDELLAQAQTQLSRTLRSVWTETRTSEPVPALFMQQLAKRQDNVYKLHPEFRAEQTELCGVTIPPFDALVKAAEARERQVPPPFSVYIHGDFNVDNIIYDPMERRINFIDLHRSQYMDYVQDVSVFMVSNYRLQILDPVIRRRIMAVAQTQYRAARRFAKQQQDDSFDFRLALGLARSFASSTRFVLDKSLARSMFLRARYLLELVLASDPQRVDKFRLPLKEIFVE
ncbi:MULTISPECIES: phosphotransferase [Marinobacter]|uniref:phosphotransferase n=1 Tax=Marinobacter TaxID=2742 RepID=UPI001D0772BD|nr:MULTISPECIES: phosphotransferase [Marinobacter]MCG8517679.1 aminoglycoside phosphotransferase family protein [Pseudomonadales bacterium]MCK7567402.1 aminoglycoside phosphotransferase family protein [Marinobacter xestospongiae]UDL05485.1 phosphotransferase [Marinobacter sp. CA1]